MGTLRQQSDKGTLLLIGGAGPAPLGVDIALLLIEQARSRKLRIHMMNQSSALEATVRACAMSDTISIVDFEDVAESLLWARDLPRNAAERYVVFSTREYAQITAAEISALLGVSGNTPDAVRRVRLKDQCRAALAQAGFRQPRVWLCRSADDATLAVGSSVGPWVVKPRDSAGSQGVTLVLERSDLRDALSTLPEATAFIVEEFVNGSEYSIEGLFRGGKPEILAITEKEKGPLPFFAEIGHVLPANLPVETEQSIRAEVVKALEVLDLRFGLFHVELWLTEEGVVMGEVHGRLGGDYIHRMLAHAIPGLEMFGEVFDDALHDLSTPVRRGLRAAACRFFTPPPGKLVSVEGWSEVTSHPSILAAELSISIGDTIKPLRSSDDRVGAIVVGGETAADAKRLASELAGRVSFDVSQPS